MYDIYEIKDNRYTVTDIITILADAYEKFGPTNVRMITRGVYSIHNNAGTIVAILVKSTPAD